MKEIDKKRRNNSAATVDVNQVDKALRVWIESADDLRPWSEATAETARETFDELHGYGIPLDSVLIEFSRLKRRSLAKEREAAEGVTENVGQIERLSDRQERERLLKSLDVLTANPVVMGLLGVNPAPLHRAATKIRSIKSKNLRGAPSRTDTREMLLPLVEIFSRHGRKEPLWKQAGELLKHAFGVPWSDPDRSASHAMKAKGRSEDEQFYPPDRSPAVPPLDSIVTKPARRAGAQILIDRARQDTVDMEVEKLRKIIDAQKKPKKKAPAQKEANKICHAIQCTDKKKALEKAVAKDNRDWQMSDESGGWFFRRAKCGRVRHSACDRLFPVVKGYYCGKCATKNKVFATPAYKGRIHG